MNLQEKCVALLEYAKKDIPKPTIAQNETCKQLNHYANMFTPNVDQPKQQTFQNAKTMESAILSAVKIHGLNPAKEISLKEVIETILINRALFVSMFRQRSQCRYVFLGFFVSHLADVVQKNLYGIIQELNITKMIMQGQQWLKQEIENSMKNLLSKMVLVLSCLKTFKSTNIQELMDGDKIAHLLQTLHIVIKNCQGTESEFQLIRMLFKVCSYVFYTIQANKFSLSFFHYAFGDTKSIPNQQLANKVPIKIENHKLLLQLMKLYIFLDPLYHETLLETIEQMVQLEEKNYIILGHFQVIIELIESKFPHIQPKVYSFFINHSEKQACSLVVDQMVDLLVQASKQQKLMDPMTQTYNIAIANSGTAVRKGKMLEIYYGLYQRNPQKKLIKSFINSLIQWNLENNLINTKQFVHSFVRKEWRQIDDRNIKKMHQQFPVELTSNNNIYSEILLQIIQQKFRNQFQYLSSIMTYLSQLNAKNIVPVLQTYLNLLIEKVTGKVDLLEDPQCQILLKPWSKGCQYFQKILQEVDRCGVYNKETFERLIFCAILFETSELSNRSEYFVRNLGKLDDFDALLSFLQGIMKMFQNKLPVLLYFHVLLTLKSEKPNKFEVVYKRHNLTFIVDLMDNSDYFRVMSYSMQSLTILVQIIILSRNQQISHQSVRIIKKWSSLMSKIDIKNLCYFFSFREMQKVYKQFPCVAIDVKTKMQTIFSLILELLAQPLRKCYNYSFNSNVCINFLAQERSEYRILLRCLNNANLSSNHTIYIKTTTARYKITIRKSSVRVERKQMSNSGKQVGKEKIINIKFQQQKYYNIALEVVNAQTNIAHIRLKLHENNINEVFEGHVVEVRSSLSLGLILFDQRIENITKNQTLFDRQRSHFLVEGGCELKNDWLWQRKQDNFISKFDFEHQFCLIIQLLNNFKQKISLAWAYNICLRLALEMVKFQRKSDQKHRKSSSWGLHLELSISHEIKCMNSLFFILSSNLACKSNQTSLLKHFNLEVVPEQGYSAKKSFCHFLLAAIVNKMSWNCFTHSDKLVLLQVLQTLFIQSANFRGWIQNENLQFFINMIDMIMDGNDPSDSKLADICDSIIILHSPNNTLIGKFKHYFYSTQQSIFLRERFANLIDQLANYLIIEGQKNFHQRILSKFLLIESGFLEFLFSFCMTESRLKILNYLTANQPEHKQNSKILSLITNLQAEQRCKLIIWFICYLKQQLFHLRIPQFLPSQTFIVTFSSMIELTLGCWADLDQVNQQEEIVSLMTNVVDIIQDHIAKNSSNCSEFEFIICKQAFVKFLVSLVYQMVIFSNDKKEVTRLVHKIFEIFKNMKKQHQLQFLIFYRKHASKRTQLLAYPLTLPIMKQLNISGVSMMLQYIYEALLVSKGFFDLSNINSLLISVFDYISYITKVLQVQANIKRPLYYVYPKILSDKEKCLKNHEILAKLKQIQSTKVFQLKGGIYYKLILILSLLVQLKPSENQSALIEFLLFPTIKVDKTKKALSRIAFDFNQGPILPIQKNTLEPLFNEIMDQHKEYCLQQDQPIHSNIIDGENDLSLWFNCFFLLKLTMHLAQVQQLTQSNIRESNEAYLKIIKKYFTLNQGMFDQFSQANLKSNFQFLSSEQLRQLKINNPQPQSQSANEINTPVIDDKCFSPRKKTFRQIDDKMYYSTSKSTRFSSPAGKIRQAQFLTQSRKRNESEESVQNYLFECFSKCKENQIHKYFSDKTKQLLLNELFHIYFVESSCAVETLDHTSFWAKESKLFFIKYQKNLDEFYTRIQSYRLSLLEGRHKIRKIYPYTLKERPINKMMANMFPNLATPLTYSIPRKDYEVTAHNESLAAMQWQNRNQGTRSIKYEDFQSLKLDDDQLLGYSQKISEPIYQIFEEQQTPQQQKFAYCELISRKMGYFCEWHIKDNEILLRTIADRPNDPNLIELKYGSPVCNLYKQQTRQFVIKLKEIVEIFYRKFNQIPQNSIQIFLRNGLSKFITFYTSELLGSFLRRLHPTLRKCKVNPKIIHNYRYQFQKCNYTDQWASGQMSNFDYLMKVNHYAGRSYNDLNQYYVFPWVLQDYSSKSLDLTKESTFRDLTKPIGALNPQKFKKYLQKYQNQTEQTSRYLYGSHYSTSLFVYYYFFLAYLCVELDREMQGGMWDAPDRLFNSLDSMWNCLMSQAVTSDIKEAIPQFYYFPVFLKNVSNIKFQARQCGLEVSDVELPKWACNIEDFIVKMRAALQSDYVSLNLHHWIDLIFGKHQDSIEKLNVFHPISYAQKIDLTKVPFDSLDAMICQISFFGQNPCRLFKKEHRAKNISINLFSSLSNLRKSYSVRARSKSQSSTVKAIELARAKLIISIRVCNNIFVCDVTLKNDRNYRREFHFNPQDDLTDLEMKIQSEKLHEYVSDSILQKEKVRIESSINKTELWIGNEVMKSLEINYQFTKTQFNEMFLVCYGGSGCRMYNWQLEEIYRTERKDRVSNVFLEHTFLIYGTTQGSLYLYDFIRRTQCQLYKFNPSTFDLQFSVIAQRSASKSLRNLTNYKILMVGDYQRVALLTYPHCVNCK